MGVLSHFLILSKAASLLRCCVPVASISSSSSSRSGGGRIPSGYLAQIRLGATDFRCYYSSSSVLSQPDSTTTKSVKKRIVSGVQPTGSIHLGNYLGPIKNWIPLQETYETFIFIADLHALTLPYDRHQLSKTTRNTAAIFLACGVDTSKASIFVQSCVHAHTNLMWLLCSQISSNRLYRMIQFKEKSRRPEGENVGVSLLTYPVLMASDILLYQSDLVPVGEDQKQHMELTREVAVKVNEKYGGDNWKELGGRGGSIFKVPEPLIAPSGGRVMSLTDGLSKMSKSAPSDESRINLLDPKDARKWDLGELLILSEKPILGFRHFGCALRFTIEKVIVNKIKRCKTDSFPGLEFDNPDRPECNNLLAIYQLITGKTKEEVTQECHDMNWGTFKPLLTDVLIDHLHPIQVRYEEIISDSAYLDRVLVDGATKASEIANATLNDVSHAMNLWKAT